MTKSTDAPNRPSSARIGHRAGAPRPSQRAITTFPATRSSGDKREPIMSAAIEQRMTDLIVHVVTSAQARHDLKAGPPRLFMSIVVGAFVGVIRNCREIDLPLDQADWTLAEQCIWEAIRS